MAQIEKLGRKTLRAATQLVLSAFPDEGEDENPAAELAASLDPKKFQGFLKGFGISDLIYWVAMEANDVVGIIGLYTDNDAEEAVWLGWFCVSPRFRGKGIGSQLLELAIEEAKSRGKKFLRLYTSTSPLERAAHRLYEAYGFKLIKREPWPNDDTIEKLYYQLTLESQKRGDC